MELTVQSATPSPGRIFISYRRQETAYPAGWLYDRLAGRYGDSQIFKDVDSIEPGDDFVNVITTAVGNCDVLLALVGDQWLTIADADGQRRLDDPNDFVRLELEAALTRDVRVIPILVDGSRMPRPEELPASLAGLVRRQALELSPTRFDSDTGRLLRVLDKTLAEVRTADDKATAATQPVAVPTAKAAPASRTELPTTPAPAKPAMRNFTGVVALASSGLMLLCIVLPQQGDTSTFEKDPIKATYLMCLGLVVLSLGVLTLTARWRIHGLGGVIGAASVSTVVALDMLNTVDSIGTSELGPGFWSGFLAPQVLFAAGVLAVAAARREAHAGLAAFHSSDWRAWVVVVLAVATAVVFTLTAMETYANYPGWGLQGIWLAVLAVAVPVTALLTRPVLLGRWFLFGWAFACATLVLPIWMTWDEYDDTSHGMWFVMLALAATAGLAAFTGRNHEKAIQGGI